MARFWSSLLVASLVATVGVSAQQSQTGSTSSQKSAQSGKSVTVSGCIERAPGASATSSAKEGAASRSAGSTSEFVLAVKPEKGAARGGAVGTSGSTMRYELDGDSKTISPHLNHQVEITGTLEPESGSSSTSSSSSSGKGAAQDMPTLRVQSLKMVSATCS